MLSRELLKIISLSRVNFHRKCLLTQRLHPSLNNRPPFRAFSEVVEMAKGKEKRSSKAQKMEPKTIYMEKLPFDSENSKLEEEQDILKDQNSERPTPHLTPEKFASEQNILEKFISGISGDIYMKKRVYRNDIEKVLSNIKVLNFSTKKQGLLLLHCCTELLSDEAPASRMALATQIWNTLQPHTTFEVEHYNELLRVHIANKAGVVAYNFITKMQPVEPNQDTYELLIRCLSEVGDLNQATEVLSNMKTNGFPASERIFHSLIVCQGKVGKPKNIEEILTMMKSLKFDFTVDTYTALARAYIYNKEYEKLLESLSRAINHGIHFGETHIMDIVKTAAECNIYDIIPKVLKFLPPETLSTPSISATMQATATQLVFQNHPMAALEIYNCLPLPAFGPRDDPGLHGRSLVRDCVKASVITSLICYISQSLMASGRNPIAFQNAAEAALQLGKTPLALELFIQMKQMGLPIRQHYFWPVLLHSSKGYGERGIINTLKTMISMEVPPDYETIKYYVLPHVSFTSPQNLMKKFQDSGVPVSTVLTPMMESLLNSGQIRAASELGELFHGKIDTEKLLKPLVKGYLMSMNTTYLVHILQDISNKAVEKNRDWIGRFLCKFMDMKKSKESLIDMKNIIKELKKADIKISVTAAENCISRLPEKMSPDDAENFKDAILSITDETYVDESGLFGNNIPHPRNMNEESLRAHLVELEAKGMNTRGVLRKLMQEYVRTGNLVAAKEILKKCQDEGIVASAGMKAAIFDLQVKSGDVESAELTLAELNKTAPNFILDEFKVIDFATLMVYRKRIDKAFDLINEQAKKRRIIGGKSVSMNCWRLLDTVAANNSHVETRNMFELLTSLQYCKPTNAILGPLIRAHLKRDDIEEAVKEFVRLSKKYRKTPLKHELLCKILVNMGDGLSEEKFLEKDKCRGVNNRMVQTILNIEKEIHGARDVQMTLIAALADVGYKKTLRKMLLDPKVNIHPDAFIRRCERFAQERNIEALSTIAECTVDLKRFDVTEVYDLMLDVYQRTDDVDRAIELWYKMQENNVAPTQKFLRTIFSMAKANKQRIPSEILALLDKRMEGEAEKNVMVEKK